MRFAVLAGLLFAAAAHAQASQLPGRGRISLLPGWSYAPQDPFLTNSKNAINATPEHKSIGAPSLWASFGYGASETVEVGIDLFGALESIKFVDREAVQRLSYGAGLAPRLLWQIPMGSLELQPDISIGINGVLVNTSGGGLTATESFVTGYSAGAGATLLVSESFGVGLEYRFMYARGRAPVEMGGSINGGGHFLLLSFSWFLAGEPPHGSVMQ